MNCFMCKGELIEKKVNYMVDLEKTTIIIIKGVPAKVCTQCGEQYFEDETSENIESIGNFAFENCTNLTEIQFNDKIKSIGDTSFGRTGIKEIVIPNSIERIYPYAFFDCNKLETVILGKNVKDIYLGTFNDCNNLKTVTILSNYEIKATSTSYYQTFSRCSSLQTIYVKAEHFSYYQNNSPWNLYKEKYQILN